MTAIERGTIYWGTCFAYRKMEARDITVEIGRSAQFAAAIIVTCTQKGRRKRSQLTMIDGKLVILNGWGHPSAGETYDAGRPVAPDSTATIHMTSYPMSDPRWHAEFRCVPRQLSGEQRGRRLRRISGTTTTRTRMARISIRAT